MNPTESACRELIEQILRKEITDEKELNSAKKAVSVCYKLSSLLSHSRILGVWSFQPWAAFSHWFRVACLKACGSNERIVVMNFSPW